MARLSSGSASASTSPSPRKGHIFGLLQRSLSLNNLSNRNLGDLSTQEERKSFLKKPLNGFHSAISKNFPELRKPKPIELASFESRHHLIGENRIEISNLADIKEDEEINAFGTSLLPETKSFTEPLLPTTDNINAIATSPLHEAESSTVPLLPGSESNHEAHYIRDNSSQKDITSSTGEHEDHSSPGSPPTQSESYSCSDVDRRTNDWKKVTLNWFPVIGNVIAEISLAVFDQLSSPKKSKFALMAMVTSFIVVAFCIVETFHKYRQGNYTWKIKGKIYWLYNENADDKPYWYFHGFFWIGLCHSSVYFHNSLLCLLPVSAH